MTLVAMIISLYAGAYHMSFSSVCSMLIAKIIPIDRTWTAAQQMILFEVRLPRIVLVALVGATLSVSGAVLQAVFRNPLVSPYLLGISSGASFGASVAVVFLAYYSPIIIQLSAFAFGLLAVFSATMIARFFGERNNTIIVLAGVVVSALFAALFGLLQYLADPQKLQTIVLWSMGNFASSKWQHVFSLAPFAVGGCVLMVLLSWRINVLSLGDKEAKALGIDPTRLRIVLIAIVSLMTSVAVSACGPIGWVGLIVPHLVRMLVGSNNVYVILGSIGVGSGFLLIADLIARSLFAFEIPVGILTAIVGAAFFVFLMVKSKRTVWQ
jgi:iron complex transport system permease protein